MRYRLQKYKKYLEKPYLFYLFPFNTSDGETRAEAGREELWGMAWKELEGMVEMDGMEGMDGIPCKDTTFL